MLATCGRGGGRVISYTEKMTPSEGLEKVTRPVQIRRVLRALWVLGILVVIVGSLIPSTSLPMRALDSLHINDKLEHLAAYAALAFLPTIHERRPFIAWVAVGLAALGVALEFGQLATGWRDFEVGDMVADAVGVCFGVALGSAVRRIRMVRAVLPHD
jgi:VanZ family protein